MSIYIGYQTASAKLQQEMEARGWDGDSSFPPEVVARVVALRDNLPTGCTLLGVYNPVGNMNAATPGVMVVETDDSAHLAFITNHYRGMLDYHWVPATTVATTSTEAQQQFSS